MKTYLFQGDSITDVGRNREGRDMGHGYATMVAGTLYQKFPGKIDIHNRAISGNRSIDLYARIKKDVINLKPDYMSVLIGVNDVWHEFGHQNGCSHQQFERNYCMFLEEVMAALPDIKIVILEPFLTSGTVTEHFGPDFLAAVKKNAAISRKIAEKYNLPFVSLQDKFDDWEKQFGWEALTREGVHPTIMGHSLIAKALADTLETVITD